MFLDSFLHPSATPTPHYRLVPIPAKDTGEYSGFGPNSDLGGLEVFFGAHVWFKGMCVCDNDAYTHRCTHRCMMVTCEKSFVNSALLVVTSPHA